MAEQTVASEARHYDVLIVGGGLIGLCSAAHLLSSQRSIGVIMGTHKGIASLAAAGMLAPTCEWNAEMPLTWLEFLRQGRDYYPSFLQQIGNALATQSDLGYAQRRFLLLDLIEKTTDLAQRLANLWAVGSAVAWLSRQEVVVLEPQINPDVIRGAIAITDDGIVNPRALHRVLCAYLAERGVDLIAGNVQAVDDRGDDLELTLDSDVHLRGSRVVIAAGAWSYEVAATFHLSAPVMPVKGQIIQLSGPPGLVNSVLFMPAGACGCFFERSPGLYITGTSEEYVSPEVTNTSRVVAAILTRVNEVLYPAGELVIHDLWSGFRPFTPDELPIIGWSTDPRVLLATGHFRNGILLAPLTGLIVSELLEGRESPVDLRLYAAQRPFLTPYRYGSAY